MYDYLIIGAGVTGITLSKKLKEAGIRNVIVLEAEAEAGGLCRTKYIEGYPLDIGGGHFFIRSTKKSLTMYLNTFQSNG